MRSRFPLMGSIPTFGIDSRFPTSWNRGINSFWNWFPTLPRRSWGRRSSSSPRRRWRCPKQRGFIVAIRPSPWPVWWCWSATSGVAEGSRRRACSARCGRVCRKVFGGSEDISGAASLPPQAPWPRGCGPPEESRHSACKAGAASAEIWAWVAAAPPDGETLPLSEASRSPPTSCAGPRAA